MPVARSQVHFLVRKLNEATNRVVGVLAESPEVDVHDLGDSGEVFYQSRRYVKLALHDRIALIEAGDKIAQILAECKDDGSL